MNNLKGSFKGWYVLEDQGVIYDNEGNHYYKDEIRSIFFQRQLHKTLMGDQYEIKSLKKQLEKKLKDIALPSITIEWGEVQERYVHPHYRK